MNAAAIRSYFSRSPFWVRIENLIRQPLFMSFIHKILFRRGFPQLPFQKFQIKLSIDVWSCALQVSMKNDCEDNEEVFLRCVFIMIYKFTNN